MLDFIEQVIGEVKFAQLRAGDITDGALAGRLGMSQSAYSAAKSKGFGLELLYKVARELGCRVKVELME